MTSGFLMPPSGEVPGTYCLESRRLVVFQFRVIRTIIQSRIHSRRLGSMRSQSTELCAVRHWEPGKAMKTRRAVVFDRIRNLREEFEPVQGAVFLRKTALDSINLL